MRLSVYTRDCTIDYPNLLNVFRANMEEVMIQYMDLSGVINVRRVKLDSGTRIVITID